MSERRPRILLAEDNPGDVFLVRRALNKHNVDVDLTVVQDGQAALRILDQADSDEESVALDLIMLDLNLPRATGSRILERIQQSRKYCRTPIIVVTSSDSPMDRDTATRMGASRYFQKPSDLAGFMHLGGIVRELLAARRTAATTSQYREKAGTPGPGPTPRPASGLT